MKIIGYVGQRTRNIAFVFIVIMMILDTLYVPIKTMLTGSGARVVRKEVKERLFEEGIEIPSPRMVVYAKDEETVQSGAH